MPCNHPRHDHIWARETMLNIKTCERRCGFCLYVAKGSAELLKQHVYDTHILPGPDGLVEYPHLSIYNFPYGQIDLLTGNRIHQSVFPSIEQDDTHVSSTTQQTASQEVAPARRSRSANYHRIIIDDHYDLMGDEEDDEGRDVIVFDGQKFVKRANEAANLEGNGEEAEGPAAVVTKEKANVGVKRAARGTSVEANTGDGRVDSAGPAGG